MRTNNVAHEHFLPFSVYLAYNLCAQCIQLITLNVHIKKILSIVCGSVLFFVFPVQQAFVLYFFSLLSQTYTVYILISFFFLFYFIFYFFGIHPSHDAIFKCILFFNCQIWRTEVCLKMQFQLQHVLTIDCRVEWSEIYRICSGNKRWWNVFSRVAYIL